MTDDNTPSGISPNRLRNAMTAEDLALYGEPRVWRQRQRTIAAKEDGVRLWLMRGKRRRRQRE